jgi:hypothetical protein
MTASVGHPRLVQVGGVRQATNQLHRHKLGVDRDERVGPGQLLGRQVAVLDALRVASPAGAGRMWRVLVLGLLRASGRAEQRATAPRHGDVDVEDRWVDAHRQRREVERVVRVDSLVDHERGRLSQEGQLRVLMWGRRERGRGGQTFQGAVKERASSSVTFSTRKSLKTNHGDVASGSSSSTGTEKGHNPKKGERSARRDKTTRGVKREEQLGPHS